MKKTHIVWPALLAAISTQGQSMDYPVTAVPFTDVRLNDQFWLPRLERNRDVTIPASFARCESTGRVHNFEMAAARKGKFCTKFPFDDTDIYKTIEGASYSMSLFPDKKLEAYVDSLIAKIAAAQEPDGYLYTARTINPLSPHPWAGPERWVKERELSHELYDAGHLYEAAAAHYLATGKRNLLDIALKNADLVCSVFGPHKRKVAPGHEVVEMGLVKLYRITGKEEYLKTARFFVEQRGHYDGYDHNSSDVWKNGSYWQDDKPVTEQTEPEGHAVRAGYLYSAMADIAALTGDRALLHAVDTIWDNLVSKKLYVQGGAGAIPSGERYGSNFELPNATAYNETCAAVANAFWNERMFLLHGDSKYIDVLEKIMYNGLISGVGLDGKSFFYTNAMEVRNRFPFPSLEAVRSGWFECSCCPTNMVRFLPAIPGYVYAHKQDTLFANLFISGDAVFRMGRRKLHIRQQNNYPWEGQLQFELDPSSPVTLSFLIRIPGWARGEAMPSHLYVFEHPRQAEIPITVNGNPVHYTMHNGYAVITRKWKKNDRIVVELPMTIHRVKADKRVTDDIGRVALQRGPIIFCAEWKDNGGLTSNLVLPAGIQLTARYRPNLLDGIVTLQGKARAIEIDEARNTVQTRPEDFTAIPYYAWANRGKGEMTVWLPEQVTGISILTKPE